MAAMSDEEKTTSGGTPVSEDSIKKLRSLEEKMPPSIADAYKEMVGELETKASAAEGGEELDYEGIMQGLVGGAVKLANGDAQGIFEVMAAGCMFLPPPYGELGGCVVGFISMLVGAFGGGGDGDSIVECIQKVITEALNESQYEDLKAEITLQLAGFETWAADLTRLEKGSELSAAVFKDFWEVNFEWFSKPKFVKIKSHIEDQRHRDASVDNRLYILFVKVSLMKLLNLFRMRNVMFKFKPDIGDGVLDFRLSKVDEYIKQLKDSGKDVLGFADAKTCVAFENVRAVARLKADANYFQVKLFLKALKLENPDLFQPTDDDLPVTGKFRCGDWWLGFDTKGSPLRSETDGSIFALSAVKDFPGCFRVKAMNGHFEVPSNEYLFADFDSEDLPLKHVLDKGRSVDDELTRFVSVCGEDGAGKKTHQIVAVRSTNTASLATWHLWLYVLSAGMFADIEVKFDCAERAADYLWTFDSVPPDIYPVSGGPAWIDPATGKVHGGIHS